MNGINAKKVLKKSKDRKYPGPYNTDSLKTPGIPEIMKKTEKTRKSISENLFLREQAILSILFNVLDPRRYQLCFHRFLSFRFLSYEQETYIKNRSAFLIKEAYLLMYRLSYWIFQKYFEAGLQLKYHGNDFH